MSKTPKLSNRHGADVAENAVDRDADGAVLGGVVPPYEGTEAVSFFSFFFLFSFLFYVFFLNVARIVSTLETLPR